MVIVALPEVLFASVWLVVTPSSEMLLSASEAPLSDAGDPASMASIVTKVARRISLFMPLCHYTLSQSQMKDIQGRKSSRSCEKGESHGVKTGKVEAWSKIPVRPGGKAKARTLARANCRGSDTQEVTRIPVTPYSLASRFARQPA